MKNSSPLGRKTGSGERRVKPPAQKRAGNAGGASYDARTLWDQTDLTELLRAEVIGRAVFHDRAIRFDWVSDEGEVVQHTHLTTTDGEKYHGRTSTAPDGNSTAAVEAILYSNSNGHVLIAECAWDDGRAESFVIQFVNRKQLGIE